MSLYAWLMIGSIAGPFALSFDKKVSFYRQWKYLFPAILINAALFLIWDSWFTKTGIWSFNRKYTGTIYLSDLPIEEWCFFLVVPYASLFIYECIKTYFPNLKNNQAINWVNFGLIITLTITVLAFRTRAYTVINLTMAITGLIGLQIFKPTYAGYFWVSYLVHLIPFLIVNGILTGIVTPEPIVIYNPNGITGFRIGTIPVEDTLYAFNCLIIPVSIYEYLKNRTLKQKKIL